MKKYIPFRIGKDGFSFLMYKRACIVLVSLLVVLIGLFLRVQVWGYENRSL